MKNSKLFQYVVFGAFIFFIIVGAILFATYRSSTSTETSISISLWGTLSADDFSSFFSRYFGESNLKYTIDYTEKSPASFDSDLIEVLASGIGPDAIILPTDLIVRYRNKIYPIPYTVLPELTFKDTFIQAGELYLDKTGVLALPFSVDPLVMYWNRDIFNNAGLTKVPSTWIEVSDLIPKLTQKDEASNILRSTVALGEFRNVRDAKDILSALFIQAGNPIVSFSSDGSFESTLKDDFNSGTSPAVLALQFFTNFSNPVKPNYSWNRSLPNSLDVFANGDLAMYFGLASEFTAVKNKNPNLNFAVALLPQGSGNKIVYSTTGDLLGLAILKNSANPAGTYTVLNALTSASAFPYWKDIFNVSSARRDILAQTESSAVKTIFNKSAIMSKAWYDPNRTQSNAIFQEMVESYTTGRSSLEGAVNTASDRLDSLL
ncbi:MAG: hypothetical protein A2541_01050 [Candidatus Taylorbacteria bacterium RIFOXYD2_FULL_36_9]|uniref:Sugar ABC transporter substrate-binding protein n=1 Tax=Candidatus Taylorbacteria bacterium RIFOXYD2_FULL_36_9 TaxID=1802338 RepID=A0A1G2PF71_9BACT|nr:MAG: hypothetical protein A2541_01050 [Candidatus Taylorbacteria bacterium RIFOXYD2_FULL_36_9]